MPDNKAKPNPEVDEKTAKGKGEGGFSPHPGGHANDDFQGEDRSKELARQVTPPGKARSK
jgi:hypothetical protein